MSFPSDSYISQVVCIATFAPDDGARHKTEAFEKAFSKIVSGQATATNIPDNFPPELPRLVLKSSKKEISLSQINVQLTMNFEKDHNAIQERFETARKNMQQFWDGVCSLVSVEKRQELGMVVVILDPSKTSLSDTHEKLFNSFSKVNVLGELASAEFKFGFKMDNVFKNFGSAVYEIRTAQVLGPVTQGQRINLDFTKMNIEEYGIEYKFDVNNRPTLSKPVDPDVSASELIISNMKNFIFTDTKSLLGW